MDQVERHRLITIADRDALGWSVFMGGYSTLNTKGELQAVNVVHIRYDNVNTYAIHLSETANEFAVEQGLRYNQNLDVTSLSPGNAANSQNSQCRQIEQTRCPAVQLLSYADKFYNGANDDHCS